jgi:hypothetical protein
MLLSAHTFTEVSSISHTPLSHSMPRNDSTNGECILYVVSFASYVLLAAGV